MELMIYSFKDRVGSVIGTISGEVSSICIWPCSLAVNMEKNQFFLVSSISPESEICLGLFFKLR